MIIVQETTDIYLHAAQGKREPIKCPACKDKLWRREPLILNCETFISTCKCGVKNRLQHNVPDVEFESIPYDIILREEKSICVTVPNSNYPNTVFDLWTISELRNPEGYLGLIVDGFFSITIGYGLKVYNIKQLKLAP